MSAKRNSKNSKANRKNAVAIEQKTLENSERVITIKEVRQHNLKNISIDLPREKLIVITGLSGSGKSTLAFDVIYAEGQRRYVESLSSYARQFLERLPKPDVEQITGLPPTIAVEQRSGHANPRSIVATTTEIYDYLRLLFARVGTPHCPKCGRVIKRDEISQIIDKLLSYPEKTKLMIFAPVLHNEKGAHKELLAHLKRSGYVRARIDGKLVELSGIKQLSEKKRHSIEVLIDRIRIKPDIRTRLADSLEIALKLGEGTVLVLHQLPEENVPAEIDFIAKKLAEIRKNRREALETDDDINELSEDEIRDKLLRGTEPDYDADWHDELFSENYWCPYCRLYFEKITPTLFSFNSPTGACPECSGLGTIREFDLDLIVPDPTLPISKAIAPWTKGGSHTLNLYNSQRLISFAKKFHCPLSTPFDELPEILKEALLFGLTENVRKKYRTRRWEGVFDNLKRRHVETESETVRAQVSQFMRETECPKCKGKRLKEFALAVEIKGKNISEITEMSIKDAIKFFEKLKFTREKKEIAAPILREISARLKFMSDVGLEYLTLDRRAGTLSGGEAQRIRLATQVGSGLVGVCYVLDEPSIGLHPRDNRRLIKTLERLRDIGNTVLVVEHDEAFIRSANFVVDLGPGAGRHGGEIVHAGSVETLETNEFSLTGKYLSRKLEITVPSVRREIEKNYALRLTGAKGNNLKNIEVNFPLGVMICVTGVSGSGKSTLVNQTLYPALQKALKIGKPKPLPYTGLFNTHHVKKAIQIDQSPIGRTPRSNPATYTDVFTEIRNIFAKTREAQIRGYTASRFSFNVKGGRCEACQGQGTKRIEMHFLPDIYVTCDVCKGTRFNRETLEIYYKGKNIADVLNMTVEEALEFFANFPKAKRILQTLTDVGLGYIRLGQPSTTLSGGEAQRVKLSSELSRPADNGHNVYFLDEPTTGLHFHDVARLVDVLNRLVEKDNTVIVIEHNIDVVKSADWIIDLGPEGGENGGLVIAEGTPEQIAQNKDSYTGKFLRATLDKS